MEHSKHSSRERRKRNLYAQPEDWKFYLLGQIKFRRHRRGMTQKEAADILGISRSQYVNMESGVSGITLENFRGLCKLYNLSPSKLLFL